MTDKDLLSRATAFDAGPPIKVNGKKWDPSWCDADRYNFQIVKRGQGAWAITDDMRNVLDKNGNWNYEPSPSSRTEEFISNTRWPSAKEAFEFLAEWRRKQS